MRLLLLGCVLLAAGSASGIGVRENSVYTCVAGDCVNGVGTARNLGDRVEYTGAWAAGGSIAGQSYEVRHPIKPGRVYRAVFDASGLQVGGDMLFKAGGLSGRSVPVFNGSYAHVNHPFARKVVAVPREGVLDDSDRGYIYEGRFDYLPSKDALGHTLFFGTYIFVGKVTDVDDGSVETGLFITDAQPNQMEPSFAPANETYLANLQRKYQQDLAGSQAAIAALQQRERAGASWDAVLGFVGQLAQLAAGDAISSNARGLAQEAAMTMVTDMLAGNPVSMAPKDITARLVAQPEYGGDETTARRVLDLIFR